MAILVLLNCFGCEMIRNLISINLRFVDLLTEFSSFIVTVVENGDNWSVGQRQLLWLGRALLKKAKILVLDEPTTVLDTLTDSIMQDIIRAEFAKSTVITIARRIPRVMDADKVLVFDSGEFLPALPSLNALARSVHYNFMKQVFSMS